MLDYQYYRCKRAFNEHNITLLNPKNLKDNSHFVLFLHGIGCDGNYLTCFLSDILIKNDIGFVSCDLEGHGSRSSGCWSFDTHNSYLYDILNFLNSIGIKNVHIVAHSLGTAVALNGYSYLQKINQNHSNSYNSNYAIKLKSFNLLCLPWNFSENVIYALPEIILFFDSEFWRYIKKYGLKKTMPSIGKLSKNRFPIRVAKTDKISKSRKMILNWLNEQDLLCLLNTIDINTQCVQGRFDTIIPNIENAKKHLKNSKVSVKTVNTTHLGVLINRSSIDLILSFIIKCMNGR